MANVTKIYELRTLGYEDVITQLNNIEKSFENIKILKKQLNELKFNTDDAKKIEEVNKQLTQEKIKTQELALQKQQLKNEATALNNVRQAEINNAKQQAQANTAESGSLGELIIKQRELFNLIKNQAPTSTNKISFDGQELSRSQAIAQYKTINGEVIKITEGIKGFSSLGERINKGLAASFDSLKGSLGQMIIMYTGWFAAFREAGKLVSENIKMSDSFADLQIRIKGTGDDVTHLFNELKKIDTRTSLASLVDIANVVAKKGVPKEEIAAITAEFDKLNVVLGKELGAPDQAAASIIKLITIFNDDKHVTAQRIQEIGTSLFKLTTSGVATGDFLIDFAERVGAVRGITGLTLPSILGMGAALQQLGQRTEVAGTAAVQLTTKVFSDVPKFAQAAGKSIEEFRATLDKNPFDALIQVAQGLKNLSAEDMAAKFEDVVQAFDAIGVRGVRVKAVLGDIGTNGEFVKQRMKDAQVSINDLGTETDAITLKQDTFAATLDRVRKEFELIATNRAVQLTLAGIASVILLVVQNLGIILPILLTYAGVWAIANSAMIATRIATVASNIAFTAQYAILTVTQTFMKAYTAALTLFTGATEGATVATTLMSTALRLLPIGIIITLIAVLAAGCQTLTAKIGGSSEALRKQAAEMAALAEVSKRANEQIAGAVQAMNNEVAVITSTVTSYDTKKAALDRLIQSNQIFSTALKGNVIDLVALQGALKIARDEIELNARAQAAASLSAERYKTYLSTVSVRQEVEVKAATATKSKFAFKDYPSISLSDLSKDERTLIQNGLTPNTKGDILIDGVLYDSKELFGNLQKKENDAFNNYDVYNKVSQGIQVKIATAVQKNQVAAGKSSSETLASQIAQAQNQKLSVKELENLIKAINEERNKLKEGDPQLKELQDARDRFQARLDALNANKTKKERPYGGAKLSGLERDDLAEIDAAMRFELATEEARFAALQLNHRATYQEQIEFNDNLERINVKFLDQKIKYLNSQGALNAREKLQLATFNKEKLDIQLKTINDNQRVLDTEFQFEQRNLKTLLDTQIEAIKAQVAASQEDASLTNVDKAQIKLNGDRRILQLQEDFNHKMDDLEKKLNQKSKENTDEGAKTRIQIIKDTTDLFNARLRDISEVSDKLAAEYRAKAAEQIEKILVQGGSPQAIARAIQKVQNQLSRDLLINQAAEQKQELDLYEQGKSLKLKSEKEYQDALARYKETEAKLIESNLNRQLTAYERFAKAIKDFGNSFAENVLKIKKYSDDAEGEAEKTADAIKQAQDTIGQAISEAYQNFFQGEKDRIDHERDVQKERLDRERELVESRATSQAEKDSLDRQYAAKAKELDRQANEQKKQVALKQLAIDFAASVIKSLAQYGLPLALLPIAAETALYFVQRSNIQRQTFEHGGVPERGGVFRGRSHAQGGIPFNYEAEDQELAIINKRSARANGVYTVTGTPKQIASKINTIGGGVEFSPGASFYRRFADGGLLGNSYTAPSYQPSSALGVDMQSLVDQVKALAIEQSKRIDRLQVYQDTRSVSDAQRKLVKQHIIGTV